MAAFATIESDVKPYHSVESLNAKKSSNGPSSTSRLYHKVARLEVTLRDKEAEIAKLNSSMKNTTVNELKTQAETYYKEVLRLNNLNLLQHSKNASHGNFYSQHSPENPVVEYKDSSKGTDHGASKERTSKLRISQQSISEDLNVARSVGVNASNISQSNSTYTGESEYDAKWKNNCRKDLEESIKRLKEENRELSSSLSQLREENLRLKSNINNDRLTVSVSGESFLPVNVSSSPRLASRSSGHQCDVSEEDLNRLKCEISDLKGREKLWEQERGSFREMLEGLKDDRSFYKEVAHKKQEELATLQGELSTLHKEVLNLQKDISQVHTDLQDGSNSYLLCSQCQHRRREKKKLPPASPSVKKDIYGLSSRKPMPKDSLQTAADGKSSNKARQKSPSVSPKKRTTKPAKLQMDITKVNVSTTTSSSCPSTPTKFVDHPYSLESTKTSAEGEVLSHSRKSSGHDRPEENKEAYSKSLDKFQKHIQVKDSACSPIKHICQKIDQSSQNDSEVTSRVQMTQTSKDSLGRDSPIRSAQITQTSFDKSPVTAVRVQHTQTTQINSSKNLYSSSPVRLNQITQTSPKKSSEVASPVRLSQMVQTSSTFSSPKYLSNKVSQIIPNSSQTNYLDQSSKRSKQSESPQTPNASTDTSTASAETFSSTKKGDLLSINSSSTPSDEVPKSPSKSKTKSDSTLHQGSGSIPGRGSGSESGSSKHSDESIAAAILQNASSMSSGSIGVISQNSSGGTMSGGDSTEADFDRQSDTNDIIRNFVHEEFEKENTRGDNKEFSKNADNVEANLKHDSSPEKVSAESETKHDEELADMILSQYQQMESTKDALAFLINAHFLRKTRLERKKDILPSSKPSVKKLKAARPKARQPNASQQNASKSVKPESSVSLGETIGTLCDEDKILALIDGHLLRNAAFSRLTYVKPVRVDSKVGLN